ncbi:MAG: Asp-tRNA(Asn)/Glu-tRNA(Gln) amidotransferase subunit GatA [Anaerolineales bacterium]|nr:Asp-tRNA(Asn)/Glu-tRNA(Gln) amidotransferase subunit GatA [Anaerolineales bacterium]
MTLSEFRQQLDSGETTSTTVTQTLLDRIAQHDPQLQSYLTLTPERALDQAKQADQRLAKGERTPLLGIPVAIKDLLCNKGVLSSAGSRILEGFRPPYDAFATQQLKDSGAIILGMTNTDEFGMGSSTENSGYQTTRNPWDTSRVPGGSSGGSAAAVAAGLAYGALGTDTDGSMRQPASFCGLVGLRPTYGRVSRWGVIAFASSLDQVGPFGRTVQDTAAMLEVVAGYDERDSTSINTAVPAYSQRLTGDSIKGLKIGLPREYFVEGIEPDVNTAVQTAINQLADLGAEIVEISLPHTKYALPIYYLIATAEASANLARYDGVRFGPRVPGKDVIETTQKTRALFGPEVKNRIMLGTYVLSAGYYDAYYGRALKARTMLVNDFKKAFEQVDIIATPTSPTTAFELGARVDDPIAMYLSDIYTVSLNLSAGCGLSVPCGFDQKGLPIGLQLLGNTLQEERILDVAYAYEQSTPWHKERPHLT